MRTLTTPAPRGPAAGVRRPHFPRRPPPPSAAPPNQNDQAAALAALLAALGASLSGAPARPPAAGLSVDGLCYAPPGAAAPLVSSASFDVPPRAAGLLFGRSGAGKTTLLQLVAGLLKPTGGVVSVYRGDGGASASAAPPPPPPRVGLVFQFPERHFLGATLADEMTFGWPVSPAARASAIVAAQATLSRLSLASIPLDTPLRSLSDGYKRRVALAVQLARQPDVLLLDEPLAGLDWRARSDMVSALTDAKQEATLLIVSHDLTELVPLIDRAWVVGQEGTVRPAKWPPSGGVKER